MNKPWTCCRCGSNYRVVIPCILYCRKCKFYAWLPSESVRRREYGWWSKNEKELTMISVRLNIRTQSEANVREHWAAKARRVKSQRRLAGLRIRSELVARPILSEMPIAVSLTRIAPRALDSDNLARSFKAIRDGVADALGRSGHDGDSTILWTYCQAQGKPKEYAVEIKIEEDK